MKAKSTSFHNPHFTVCVIFAGQIFQGVAFGLIVLLSLLLQSSHRSAEDAGSARLRPLRVALVMAGANVVGMVCMYVSSLAVSAPVFLCCSDVQVTLSPPGETALCYRDLAPACSVALALVVGVMLVFGVMETKWFALQHHSRKVLY